MKELFTYNCAECKKAFRTEDPDQKVCPDCLKFRQPHHKSRKNKAIKKPLTFAQISHISEIYYKIHHKYLHYGDMVNLIRLHPQQCVCCGAKVTKNKHICAKCEKVGK